MIAAMKQNVQNPPHEFTDLTLRIARGSVGFFKESVANWAKDAAGNDAVLLGQFNEANKAAADSLEDGATWLEKTLLPNSKGAYAIGAENFSKKLQYEEMVDAPLDRILAIGEANLEKDYNAFIETARKIDPSRLMAWKRSSKGSSISVLINRPRIQRPAVPVPPPDGGARDRTTMPRGI